MKLVLYKSTSTGASLWGPCGGPPDYLDSDQILESLSNNDGDGYESVA